MRLITKVFLRLVMAVLVILIINSFQSVTQLYLSLNVFNVLMISLFDIFGVILCVVLNFIL
ncbi:MAG: pro-sigmaK processing inhibitor BofA family protein [Coprobacillus sp.]